MGDTRAAKTEYLSMRKRSRVKNYGCRGCEEGREYCDFRRYWYDKYQYNPRRFVFKYTEPRGSDVPVAKLPRLKNTTIQDIDHALSRCVILCRTCSDPRRTKKEMTKCQNSITRASPRDS